MSELPITPKEYDRSVWIVSFIGEVKKIAEKNENVSDFLFTPTVKGYEIKYCNKCRTERISVNSNSRFYKGLVIKKYADGKFKGIFCLNEKKISTDSVNKILG